MADDQFREWKGDHPYIVSFSIPVSKLFSWLFPNRLKQMFEERKVKRHGILDNDNPEIDPRSDSLDKDC